MQFKTITADIAGYDLTEILHQGQTTIIYRGCDQSNQQPVILKVLNAVQPTLEQIASLRHEYQITEALSLEGVVKAYRLEVQQNRLALVYEDFGGESLKQWLLVQKPTLLDVLNMATQLATALQALHRYQIIHKDIKPANIIINPHTRQVKLTDFSIASRLSQENQALAHPNQIEGTLFYMSPEQTGRMNRSLDYRTDFYSLGITLYELLSGQLPFQSSDPLELVYCHLAKEPISLHQLAPTTPASVAAIVSKLMAKNAEDRYQSATGLLADLQRCLEEFKASRQVSDFAVGRLDRVAQLNIPQKLYGREQQVETLLAAFERARQGNCELVTVGGYSGIGKTSLIHELYKPVTQTQAHFISGKFDQFKRDVPLACLAEAYRGLVQQILTESQDAIAYWQQRFLAAVGQNGKLIIDVIPELELLIGQQPPVADLPAIEARNRFYQTFEQFLIAAASPDYPLVIFMDDMQWADRMSIQSLSKLVHHPESAHRLIIAAYRDNEVEAAHPFMQALQQIEADGFRFNSITLEPLSLTHVGQLVAEALSSEVETIQSLAQLLYDKTQGNPFFLAQLLKSLHHNGLLTFDYHLEAWQWDIHQLSQQNITDNVVALMIDKLRQLPQSTQICLQLAACIGNQFDLQTLATISQQPPQQALQNLWQSIELNLILPLDRDYRALIETKPQSDAVLLDASLLNASLEIASGAVQNPKFKFLHDRVQEAAYELIPSAERPVIHLTIGRLLLYSANNNLPGYLSDAIFEIVNHWNIAIALLSASEKQQLAELNLTAACKAKASAAYEPALKYFTTGLELLSEQSWQTDYSLMLALHEGAAEAAYLCGEFAQVQQWSEAVLNQGKTILDKVKVYDVQVQTYMAQAKPLQGIQTALTALSHLGIQLPESPTCADIQQNLAATKALWSNQQISRLAHLPLMPEGEHKAAMAILSSIFAPSFAAKPELLSFIACEQIRLSIQHGNCAHSAFGYSNYAALLNTLSNDLEGAYQFGQLAVQLVRQLDAKSVLARTFNQAAIFSMHGKVHLQQALPILQEGCQSGVESGDLEFAGYAAYNHSQYSYFASMNLDQLQQAAQSYSKLLQKLNLSMSLSYNQIVQQVALNLLGQSADPCCLVGEALDEVGALRVYQDGGNRSGVQYLFLHKLILAYLFEDTATLLSYTECCETHLDGATGTIMVPEFCFYSALARLAIWDDSNCSNDSFALNQAQNELQRWAEAAPMNFQHKFDLVTAEWCRVQKQIYQAADYYDRAIAGALANGYIQEAAIANELAAKFYLGLGKLKIAQAYLLEAYEGFQQWGAVAKVEQLQSRYAIWLQQSFLQPEGNSGNRLNQTHPEQTVQQKGYTVRSNSTSSQVLDLTTVMKAAQAISSELTLNRLLDNLLHIILENAAAQQGCIILERDGQLFVEVATLNQAIAKLQSAPLETSQNLPLTVIHYVARTRQAMVIGNAVVDAISASDAYVQRTQPKSLLCAPILYQGKLLGVIYLENNLVTHAFTNDRVEFLQMLTAQAAIAIENAYLYSQEQEKAETLARLNSMLRASEARLRLLIDRSADAMTLIDGDLIIDANRSAVKMFRCIDQKQLLSIHPSQISPEVQPDGQCSFEKTNQMIALAYQQGNHRFEWVHRRMDGEDFWVEISLTVIPIDEKPLLFTVIREIGDYKRAKAALQQANAILEEKVNARTKELQQANEALEDRVAARTAALEQVLTRLQQTQAQLVQTEKMSALGNLVAGIAHEINNPIGFLTGSVKNAQDYIHDLFTHLELYQQHYPNPTIEIQTNAAEIDLEFLLKDLLKLLNSMNTATDRIKNISTSLRTFSRADAEHKISADLHEGLDSTLLILKYRLKANSIRPEIEVVKSYGDLPLVECFSGQLNQVFMNLLANAIDAIDESCQRSDQNAEAHPKQIKIQTVALARAITIRICDNGFGIPEPVKARIFDHLFTTKSVGQGTGLGLSIARQIVEDTHGGQLSFSSTLGEGTEFVIQLPL